MSLADELLADLEDGGDVVNDVPELDDELEDVAEVEMEAEDDDVPAGSVRRIAKLLDSDQLTDIITRIEFFKEKGRRIIAGAVEADPEYELIVDANAIVQEIDNEISKWSSLLKNTGFL